MLSYVQRELDVKYDLELHKSLNGRRTWAQICQNE